MYNTICVTEITTRKQKTGCGSAWLERLIWDQEVAGSNPVTPTISGCSSMVELQPSKLITWVRFPSPAWYLFKDIFERIYPFFHFTGKNYKQ